MSLCIKICGLTDEAELDAVCALRPDAIGFVCWPRSKRYVEPSRARMLADRVPAGILKVGVVVDTPPTDAHALADRVGLDVLQLHGAERPAAYQRAGLLLWRVARLDDPPATPDAHGNAVDALVLDQYSADSPGGTGRTLDWDRAAAFVRASDRPVILAGGLTPENVGEAVRRVRPWGVDVSSGVERAPGRKAIERVRRFIETCRAI